MSRSFYDINPAGDVLCTYTDSGEKEKLKSEKTEVPLPKAVLYAFLPAGYPHSVTDDYLAYQTFDSLQAFASSITSLLANRAVLEGLGGRRLVVVPNGRAHPQDHGRHHLAHRHHPLRPPHGPGYRARVQVLPLPGRHLQRQRPVLDLLTPALPYFPKLGVIVSAGVLRSLCGVAANASKASLSAHFALTGNLAELNAKEASQETVVGLLGMLAGSLVVRMVEDKQVVWMLMVVLAGVHLAMNYHAVRAVKMRSLNRQRATLVFREWLAHGTVLTPEQVAQRESILRNGRGNLTSKSGDYTGFCDFGTYGDLVGWNPRGYHRYDFETSTYFMGIWHRGGYFYMRIALKEGTKNPLSAWFDAVNHAYHFDSALKDGLQSHYENEMPLGYVSEEQKQTIFAAMTAAGWDLEVNALETRLPVRVRVGDGRKGPYLSEKDPTRHNGLLEAKHD